MGFWDVDQCLVLTEVPPGIERNSYGCMRALLGVGLVHFNGQGLKE